MRSPARRGFWIACFALILGVGVYWRWPFAVWLGGVGVLFELPHFEAWRGHLGVVFFSGLGLLTIVDLVRLDASGVGLWLGVTASAVLLGLAVFLAVGLARSRPR